MREKKKKKPTNKTQKPGWSGIFLSIKPGFYSPTPLYGLCTAGPGHHGLQDGEGKHSPRSYSQAGLPNEENKLLAIK